MPQTIADMRSYLWEFFVFGTKEARACIFAGSFFVLLFLSHHIPLFGLHRYDFLFLAALFLQIVLLLTKIETWDEVKTIFLFHVLGTALELFKTHPAVGSWTYPEEAFFKIATVPLFAGFMYAAVGSYIAQAWRIFKLELENPPNYLVVLILGIIIYLNFFANYFIPDLRLVLIPAVFLLFAHTSVTFLVTKERRSMPLALAFCLIAFFIWLAENISTFYGAWKYPSQIHAWSVVSTNKITSWFLLVIISFIVVAYLKHYKKDVLRR
ncbi:MAG TPA: DUF817 domain-containing protein [Candidatus Paceibacterota bacterium]|nr:DUF817 domain-containing protein [Candidatus Paceibacterota bacterium]